MIKYPFSDFHEMNLNWMLEKVKEVEPLPEEVENNINVVNEAINNLNTILNNVPTLTTVNVGTTAPTQTIKIKCNSDNGLALLVFARRTGTNSGIGVMTKNNRTIVAPSIMVSTGYSTAPDFYLTPATQTWDFDAPAGHFVTLIPLYGQFEIVE